MLEKLIAWMNSRRYNSHLMRLLVGGYIAYMGIQIMINQYNDGAYDLPLSACAILLIVLGMPIALISLYAVFNGYSVEYKGKTNIFQAPDKRAKALENEEESEEE